MTNKDSFMKAQSSMELLTTVAIAMFLLIPATLLFTNYTTTTTAEVSSSQLVSTGNQIITSVNEMHAAGPNSWTTLEVSFPQSVEEVKIYNNSELNIRYNSDTGVSDLVFYSNRVNIDNNDEGCDEGCDLTFGPGLNRVRIESKGNIVSIYRVD